MLIIYSLSELNIQQIIKNIFFESLSKKLKRGKIKNEANNVNVGKYTTENMSSKLGTRANIPFFLQSMQITQEEYESKVIKP